MLKVVNPANEKILRELEEDTAKTVAAKFEKAKAAQPAWAATPVKERIAIIQRFRNALVENEKRLSEILTSEVGKPISQSHNELKGVLKRIDFFLEKTFKTLQDEVVLNNPEDKLEEKISFEPLGVVANISAWNYPYLVGSNVFIPALLTGNTVLYKPSEFSTLTGLAIAELFHKSGVPQDVFIPLVGTGAIGAELLKAPINGIFFTGSYVTGKKIAETVAGRMIRVQLELGGKDPTYVCEDVDLATAVDSTSDGAFYNNGQSCCSIERIYVHTKIYEAYVEAFVKAVQGFKVGDPADEKTYIGALTRQPQLKVLERQVADAVAKGARLLCGGKTMKGPGYFFEPTVLTNVNHTMEVMKEESFGPIIGIQKVASDDEALKLMNDSFYGLTAGVYTKDRARAERLMQKLNSGSAYWNCCDRVSPNLPWSGRGHSGIGSTLSTYGIQAFTQPKGWHLKG